MAEMVNAHDVMATVMLEFRPKPKKLLTTQVCGLAVHAEGDSEILDGESICLESDCSFTFITVVASSLRTHILLYTLLMLNTQSFSVTG